MLRRFLNRLQGLNVSPEERQLFDPEFYLARYPDVAAAEGDAAVHYFSSGWREGRHPSALFDVDWYASQLSADIPAKMSPLRHYVTLGAGMGLSTSPLFDGNSYAQFHGRKAGSDFVPLVEFLRAPPEARFDPCPLFDMEWFIGHYADVLRDQGNPLRFFASAGARSGCNPSAAFDCAWYLAQYIDVAASPWNPLAHYLAVGQFEGRRPLPPGVKAGGRSASLPSVGAHEEYGEYTARHTGEARLLPDDPPVDLAWQGRLAVHLHIFYEDMIEPFAQGLAHLPAPHSLFISVPDMDLSERVRSRFGGMAGSEEVVVAVVPNRGRDLAPMLITFKDALKKFDLLLHMHSKKSVHSDEKRDWFTQMRHHLLASPGHAAAMLNQFNDCEVGLVFPVYHPSVRDQINWGSNQQKVSKLLRQMGIGKLPAVCPAFPAGSFFVIRTELLRPLWNIDLQFTDFDEDRDSVDGAAAHAVERILGMLPGLRGQRALQVRSARPHSLSSAWLDGRVYRSPLLDELIAGARKGVPATEAKSARGRRMVVYSCATGGYDVPLPVEHTLLGAEYVFFTDEWQGRAGVWEARPLVFDGTDPVRQARYHKTSPHLLFPDADIVIWVDANIAISGDMSAYVDKVIQTGAAFGAVRHPLRHSLFEEADALAKLGIESPEVLDRQTQMYRQEAVPDTLGLTETNFLVMNLRCPQTRDTLELWREQIQSFSRRDQVSFDYARWKAGASVTWLFEQGGSVRSNDAFAYFSHGGAGHTQAESFRRRAYGPEIPAASLDAELSAAKARAAARSVDVIVPVHNAPQDVTLCLSALTEHRTSGIRIILVDDGSGEETSSLLRRHVSGSLQDVLIRHGAAKGYSGAINAGLRASEAEVMILLNSDAIVTSGSILNLVAALERSPGIGLAGPLSNAATWQSVPEQVGPDGDYLVNPLPEGWTAEDMAGLCDRLPGDPHVSVPALNGFCLAVRRQVVDTIGDLDQAAFPEGYGEETDYCFRAADSGFGLRVAADAYVFHTKSRSFGHEKRRLLSEAGFQTLLGRYGSDRLTKTLWALKYTARLKVLRQAVQDMIKNTRARGT